MYIIDYNKFSFLGNSTCKFFVSYLRNNFTIGNFRIVFSNKTLKKISNRTLNKFIKVKLKFGIHKSMISFYIIN